MQDIHSPMQPVVRSTTGGFWTWHPICMECFCNQPRKCHPPELQSKETFFAPPSQSAVTPVLRKRESAGRRRLRLAVIPRWAAPPGWTGGHQGGAAFQQPLDQKLFMNKYQVTPLALATLLACAPAWAQSNVTIYGAVDVAVGKAFQVDASQIRPGRIGLQSSSMVNLQDSFVGFRGVEDLGGGLQAGFQLEQKFDASSGANDPEGAFARSSNIWVGGGWGRITLGRAATPSYKTMAAWDLMGAGNHSIANHTFGAVGFQVFKYQANQISYRTPQLGDFVFEAAYVPKDDNLADGANRSKIDLGATYRTGPLTLGAAYNKSSGQDPNFALGAKYQYQNLEFAGGYFQARNGLFYDDFSLQRIPNGIIGTNGFTLGTKATWNQFSAGIDVTHETKSEYKVGNARFDSKKNTNFVINGTYALSKRTYAYINYLRWAGIANYGVGLSHSF